MSTPAGAARYIIAADDKTKGAVASVISGFRRMERNIKGTVSRINIGLGLIAGVGVKRVLQNVFTETAKQSKEFAFALDDAKRAARSLLAAKDGAPAATEAMRELAMVLKDPEVVAAADAIASVFIRGAAGAVKFATGVKSLEEELEELKRRRDALASGEGDKRRTFIKGEPSFNPNAAQEIFGISAEVEQKQRQIRERDAAQAKALEAFWERVNAAADKASRRFETMREFEANIKDLEAIEKKLKDGAAGDADFWEQMSREGEMADIKSRNAFFESMDEAARDVGETMERTGDSIDQVRDAIGRSIEKTEDWSVATDQAARNVHDALADYIFDPFEKNARGMLKTFIDILRRMAAEVAAQQIFKSVGGIEGISSFLGGLLGFGSTTASATPGSSGAGWSGPRYAEGTAFVPHDQLALLHRGERVVKASDNQRGAMGGVTVHIETKIDARGATRDAIKALPEVLKRNNEALEARIVQRLRSGKYG